MTTQELKLQALKVIEVNDIAVSKGMSRRLYSDTVDQINDQLNFFKFNTFTFNGEGVEIYFVAVYSEGQFVKGFISCPENEYFEYLDDQQFNSFIEKYKKNYKLVSLTDDTDKA